MHAPAVRPSLPILRGQLLWILTAAVLALAGCADGGDSPGVDVDEICDDGLDNNGNGAIDCLDLACLGDAGCVAEICDDGLDNDGDSDADCDDADCAQSDACRPDAEVCDDGADNDDDGDTDCADADCEGSDLCREVCTDGADNDADGAIDCVDDDCEGDPSCVEVECDNGVDDDKDGATDCDDEDCFDAPACIPVEDCTDGVDNDRDGTTDCGDTDCTDDEACQEICDDGRDNDADGETDCADEDCADKEACREICDDRRDNDADGDVDCADDDCADDEACQEVCDDGRDNDADGDVDCADDDCADDEACQEICDDGQDNDADGDTDCADDDCDEADACQEICDDGRDNDADGDADCADDDCAEEDACQEICDDGLDNDADGDVDCADNSCVDSPLCIEDCTDGIDNDADGQTDCADESCAEDPECNEVCDDNVDNDADGDTDCADDDCALEVICQEDCTDGIDNDADGDVDCADNSCADDPDCDEVCDDGEDHDADGRTDCLDSDCADAQVCQEDCGDGIDNDADGDVDCADDSCAEDPACQEDCDDGIDNDADGDVDCADNSCVDSPLCVEDCTDGVDNDADGDVDCADASCSDNPACQEVCDDGEDNDADGDVDCADADCEGEDACAEICDDGVDNDADGRTDCADSDCAEDDACQEICDDGQDNDADGQTDCADSDCAEDDACQEICDDGQDNDADGRTDCLDSDCADDDACQEICDDGEDNDADGATDCVDADCAGNDVCQEVCDDGEDNDADGRTDCADADCAIDESCLEVCDDGEDNDADGRTDCADSDCFDNDACQEVCDDGEDNDADGRTDCVDPDCFGTDECTEICDDGEDNDADGRVDCGDPDCIEEPDCNEPPIEICDNGIDDDNNEAIDCADPACTFDPACIEICDNGIDDDDDDLIDCLDDECLGDPICQVAGGVCDDPIRIDRLGAFTGTTEGRENVQSGTCQPNDGAEAVYVVAFNAPTPVCIDTNGSAFDTVLYVRQDDCAEGTEVACDDDTAEPFTLQSEVEFLAEPGTDYFVFVDSFQDNAGPYTLNIRLTPCAQEPQDEICDNGADEDFDGDIDCADSDCADLPECAPGLCTNPIVILEEGPAFGTNEDATDDGTGGCGGDGGRDVVYAVQLTGDGTICLDTVGSEYDTVLYVREGDCAEGPEVGCNDDFDEGLASQLELQATGGVTYFIYVDAVGDAVGNHVLTTTLGPCAPVQEFEICDNGQDDDNDEQIDCADQDCAFDPACVENCNNGIDDDNDGAADCLDDECIGQPICDNAPAGVCEDPIIIDRLGAFAGTTEGREDLHDGSCQPNDDAEAVYAVAFNVPTPVCVDTNGSQFDTVLYVREGDCAEGAELGCQDDILPLENLQSEVEFQALPGITYFVFVDGFTGNAGAYQLNIRLTPCEQEPQDEICDNGADEDFDGLIDCADPDCADIPECVPGVCTNPIPILQEGPEFGTNLDATDDGAGQCGGGGGRDVVYSLSVTGDTPVCLDTVGSDYDTVLHVREANCVNGPEVGCNDDFGVGLASQVEVQAAAGVTYFIYVDALNEDEVGNYVLNTVIGPCQQVVDIEICDNGEDDDGDQAIDCADDDCAGTPQCPPTFGTCEQPRPIQQLGTLEGDTTGLDNANSPGCQPNDGPEDVWVFAVGAPTPVCLRTAGTQFDTVLYVREGDCQAGDLACNDDTADTVQSEVQIDALPGVPYFVFVDGFADAQGPYQLTIQFAPCDQQPQDEICDNGEDDDLDGPIDCADDDCAAFPACAPGLCTNPLPIDREGPFFGSNLDAPANHAGLCGGDAGSEVIYAFQIDDQPATVCLDTIGSTYDTVLYVRAGDCVGGAEQCNDDIGFPNVQSQLEITTAPGTPYFVFVDAFDDENVGDYILNVRLGPCGAQAFEVCDNLIDDDDDGDIDCRDEDCVDAPQCVPTLPVDPGDILVTEVMYDTQTPLSEAQAEWFELYNNSGRPLILDTCSVTDFGGASADLSGVVLSPEAYAVFARSGDPDLNGGLDVQGTFTFSLNNDGDLLNITCGNNPIDTVAYDDGPDFPNAQQATIQLDPGAFDVDANDSGNNWCLGTEVYFAGEPGQEHRGTPGEANTGCFQGAIPFSEQELQALFNQSCGGCHTQGGRSGGLALDDFPATTIDVLSSTALDYIEPGDPDGSYILHKLLGTQFDVGGGGSRMPQGGPFWSDTNIARLIAYIETL